MEHARIAARLYNAPLLLTPAKADVLDKVFREWNAGTVARPDVLPRAQREQEHVELALAGIGPVRRAEGGYTLTSDGVAIVPVLGTLVQRGSTFDAMSGVTSYDRLGGMIEAALSDYRVRGIVLDIDSPGGEAAGVAELARAIRAAGEQKPVYAVANEGAFSAAYWVASAAERLLVPASGMVGSVGVIALHVDQSVADAKRGLVYTPVFAGARKNDFTSHEPLSQEARAGMQAIVDRLYGQFVDAVAANRGMSAQAVRDTEAGVLDADAAVRLGLADEVGTLGDAVRMVRDAGGRPGARAVQRAESTAPMERAEDMTEATKPAAATADQLATERAAGFAEGNAAGRAEGATAERARVQSILASEAAKDRPALAAHLAFESDMQAEAAVAMLAKAGVEAPVAAAAAAATPPVNALAEHMAATGNPQVGADAESNDAPRVSVIRSTDVFAQRYAQAEAARKRA
jgi:signal peptide peptidase SppA